MKRQRWEIGNRVVCIEGFESMWAHDCLHTRLSHEKETLVVCHAIILIWFPQFLLHFKVFLFYRYSFIFFSSRSLKNLSKINRFSKQYFFKYFCSFFFLIYLSLNEYLYNLLAWLKTWKNFCITYRWNRKSFVFFTIWNKILFKIKFYMW